MLAIPVKTLLGHFNDNKFRTIESQYSAPDLASPSTINFGIELNSLISSGSNSFHPRHFGSPIRIESVQYSHKLISSLGRNFGSSINMRVTNSKLCFDAISTLFISFNIAIITANRLLVIDSEFDLKPIRRKFQKMFTSARSILLDTVFSNCEFKLHNKYVIFKLFHSRCYPVILQTLTAFWSHVSIIFSSSLKFFLCPFSIICLAKSSVLVGTLSATLSGLGRPISSLKSNFDQYSQLNLSDGCCFTENPAKMNSLLFHCHHVR